MRKVLTLAAALAFSVAASAAPPPLDVPTFMEAGVPDFEASAWVAILAPATSPATAAW